jgi:hypothetical protein
MNTLTPPAQQVGQTAADYAAVLADWNYRNGLRTDGSHAAMAATWTGQTFVTDPKQGGIEVK